MINKAWQANNDFVDQVLHTITQSMMRDKLVVRFVLFCLSRCHVEVSLMLTALVCIWSVSNCVHVQDSL